MTAVHDFTGLGETATSALKIQPQAELVDPTGSADRGSFSDLVKTFAADVNDMQFQAGDAIDSLVTGEAADVHQVMVAVQQAGIAMDLMLEIRNRVLEGYQELIRMQV
ncbi:MAG: flagellar hook-basal body complex protein FliE [Gemmatimonadetes bacterium]|nr:flagellar hook-basal body complex protein FliE [Gemmatimonadota bacterium]MBT7862871.1 flagellar hook-basal body complex protein FliE [Gemmatimonadota bacterium]